MASLADVSFHIVAYMYARFRYSGKNPMRFAVFWRISVRFCGFRTPLTPPSFYKQKFQETEKFHVRKVKCLVRATERKMSVWQMETSDNFFKQGLKKVPSSGLGQNFNAGQVTLKSRP